MKYKDLPVYLCPNCRQDMKAKPHKGLNDKDCPQCGQGINWKAVLKKGGK